MKGREELLTMSCYLHCFNKLHCFFVQMVNVITSTALNYASSADVHNMSPTSLRLNDLSSH